MEFTDYEVRLISELINEGLNSKKTKYDSNRFNDVMNKIYSVGLRQMLKQPSREAVE